MIVDQPELRRNIEVLIVDDNASNLRLLIDIIKAYGYAVLSAVSGELALQIIQTKMPSLVILDVMMPGMDGFEVCRRLKADVTTCEIPVIFISALDDDLSKVTGFQVGGVDYITKPFRKEEVLARVNTHINLSRLQLDLKAKNEKLEGEIIKRKQAEQILLESEERFRTTLFSIGDGVITTDKNGCVKLLNPVAENLTGWKQAEAEGRDLEDVFCIINEKDRNQVEIPVRKVLREGAVVGLANHTLLIAKNGTERPIADSSAPIRNENREITGVVLVFRDQTKERATENTLRENEEHYNAFINSNVDMIFVKDDQFRYLMANDSMAKFFGKTKEQLINKTDQELADEMTVYPCRSSDHKALETETAFMVEEKLGDRIFEATKFPLPLKGHKKGIGGIIRDITERKKAEETTKNERKFLRALIDNLPDAIFVKDNECRKRVANRFDVENIGFSTEAEVLGKTDLELFPEEIGQRGYADDLKVIQTGQAVINREEVFLDKDGHQRWLLTSKIPLFDQQEKSVGLVGIGRDITEIKKAEHQIQKLTKSIEQSPSTIVITDVNGNIEYVNPKFSDITGYTADEVIGKNPRILSSGQMPAESYKQMWETITSGDVWRGEFLNRKKNGELYWEWATMTSIKNENGLITNYIAIKEDISIRKQMEADLIIAKNKAEESDRLKSAFLANMSHEIRTPLNSIIGFSELLVDPDFEESERGEFLQHIIDNGNNLLIIISDILDISKMESGLITIRQSQIKVNKFISGIKEQVSIKLKNKNLEFRVEMPDFDKEISILADVDRLRQVFNNLISNSLKFTTEGYIQISYQIKGEMVEFCVKDTGIGIPEEFHEKIFDRFRQVESSNSRKYGGNGLGLAITRNLIELMGGKIWLESEPGKGSMFYFTIPLHQNQ